MAHIILIHEDAECGRFEHIARRKSLLICLANAATSMRLPEGVALFLQQARPISNSMTEMYTLMRYLQYNTLQQKGLTHFDAWASTFGETTTAIELAPEGTGYRARTRFAKFFNVPELMAMFKEAADIKTSDQLNLPVPEAKV